MIRAIPAPLLWVYMPGQAKLFMVCGLPVNYNPRALHHATSQIWR
jgi:hypothetical protein